MSQEQTNKPAIQVELSDCGQYAYITKDGIEGQVCVKFDDEGVVVDLFCKGESSVATTYATYAELAEE